MSYTADLHLHSSFARGTSPSLDLATMSRWARLKGIDLLATGDFTHPVWLEHLRRELIDAGGGLLRLASDSDGPRFVLGTELSCVFPQGGRSRRIHLLVLAPDFEAVDRLCAALAPHGSLASDGRPMLRLSGRDVVTMALEADPRCVVIPAHAWTPWYSVYGSKGGFDSLEECFRDMTRHIHAIETGLSSDPSMNWRVPELDELTIVSFSDAHSPGRMGRELTVFAGEPSYDGLREALAGGGVEYTIEFFPEEGKYHYDGHRKCGVCQHPAVTLETGERCGVCGRPLTLGVLHRHGAPVPSAYDRRPPRRRDVDGPGRPPGPVPASRSVAGGDLRGDGQGRRPRRALRSPTSRRSKPPALSSPRCRRLHWKRSPPPQGSASLRAWGASAQAK